MKAFSDKGIMFSLSTFLFIQNFVSCTSFLENRVREVLHQYSWITINLKLLDCEFPHSAHGPLADHLMDAAHNNHNSFIKIQSGSSLIGWLYIISAGQDALCTVFNQSTGKQGCGYRILVLE